jgi:error-prone DNA polymerase
MYCELHCHTYYSFLDGVSSPETLLERAAALGMPALAITDHDGLYGAVAFWRAARALGIRPVIGAELSLAHGSHLTLLAETQAGYANLCRLISLGHLRRRDETFPGLPTASASPLPPFPSPSRGRDIPLPLSIEDLAAHSAGLLCLSGCRQGAVSQAVLAGDEERARRTALRLRDIFGRDRLWIELQRHWLPDDALLNAGLLAVAVWAGLDVVATNDVHYVAGEDHRLHDVLTATRHNLRLAELGALQRPNSEYYLKGEPEMATLFAERPDALAATQAIAERCSVSLDFSRRDGALSPRRLPAFPARTGDFPYGIPPGETAFSVLHGLCHQGLRVKYHPVTPQAMRQLAHELSVIEATGLADYFLIVWDIVRFSRSQGIRCQGRGSAANSLVAYLLGITPVDPLRYDLLFERFLSDRTDTMPDIDIDFAADRRDEVITYVYERYGVDHAAMVCNVVTYRERLAAIDWERAFGEKAENITMETTSQATSRATSQASFTHHHAARNTVPASPTLSASSLVGLPRHISVHVGGILITAQPLVEVVPLQPAAKPGIVVAQWNKDSVEDAGLIKIDLLALRTLGMVTEVCQLIDKRFSPAGPAGGKPAAADRWAQPPRNAEGEIDLDALPLDDPAVYRLLLEADTIGAFQVESRAQSQMLPRLKPTCFPDIIIQVSIVRPGPIQGGMVHPYLRRRAGLEPVTYLHPRLEPILKETLGVIIFQEQVIRVAVALAGFTPGEADMLRRAMSRSRSAEAMEALRERFIAGAVANAVELRVAEEAFSQLQGFATYGFCKSHAAAFALVAYQTLWLKAHYPVEFYCALLNQQPMGFYSPEVVVNDARHHGLTILRPDVNRSLDECTLENIDLTPRPPSLKGNGERGSPSRAGEGLGERWPRLRLGLRYLHGLGEAGRARLLAARGAKPFTDLAAFCRRTRLPRPLIRDLIRAGALDSLAGVADGSRTPSDSQPSVADRPAPPARRQMLWALGDLRYEEEALLEEPATPVDLPPLEEGEVLSWDYELLGLSPDDHPLRLWRARLSARGVLTAAELADQPAGRIVQVAGLAVVRQAPPTAKGHLFITLEDETGLANLIIRPDLYQREEAALHNSSVLLVAGLVQREGKAVSLLVRQVLPLP